MDLGGTKSMDVGKLAEAAIKGMKRDTVEICPGPSKILKLLSRIAPAFAMNMMAKANKESLDGMKAKS